MQLTSELRDGLLAWFRRCGRPLPWRENREPYRVWLSEIMCQQTRVEAVKGYYQRFLDALPDIPALAACEADRLLKLWEGLGYYSRARNLQKAAQQIMARFAGVFPDEYASIRSLPGIGDYTAAAIGSICFRIPVPAVDGNVLRVYARFTGYAGDIRLQETKKVVRDALLPLFEGVDSGELNQALMELGALICRPNGEPNCRNCPLSDACASRAEERWRTLPVKSAARPRRSEEMTVLLLRCDQRIAIRKRPDSGLLADLWEFPHVTGTLDTQAALDLARGWGCLPAGVERMTERSHIFTHVTWQMRGYELSCAGMPEAFLWVSEDTLREAYSLPTAFRQFLENSISES